ILKFFLVNKGIDTYCRLTCLTVTDDQLTLSTANRTHSDDRFDTGLQWLSTRVTVAHPRGLTLTRHLIRLSHNRTCAIDRLSQCIYNTTQHAFTDFNRCNAVGTLYAITFFDFVRWAQKNHTYVVFFQVQYDTL